MTARCSFCGNNISQEGVRCMNCLTAYQPRLSEAIDRYYNKFPGVSQSTSDTYRRPETFQEKVQLLLPRLENLAAEGQYDNQTAVIGDGIDIWALKFYLGAASAVEHWDGRPLLSSVIINEKRGFPAGGYFRLVESLEGLPDDIVAWSETEKEEWWREELSDVHEYWDEYRNQI